MAGCPGRFAASAPSDRRRHHLVGGLGEHRPQPPGPPRRALESLLADRRQVAGRRRARVAGRRRLHRLRRDRAAQPAARPRATCASSGSISAQRRPSMMAGGLGQDRAAEMPRRWRRPRPRRRRRTRSPRRPGFSTGPGAPSREINPASRAGGTATAGPKTAAAAWRSRSAGSIGPTTRAARSSADGAQSKVRPRRPPARRAASRRRGAPPPAPPGPPTPAPRPRRPRRRRSPTAAPAPPRACTCSSTGRPVASPPARPGSRRGPGRCPAPSETQIDAAPGSPASARASSIQIGSPGSGGPTIRVGTNSTPAS